MSDYIKIVSSIRDGLYSAWAADNKTIAGAQKSCNDSIVSEIKKVIGALAKVTKVDVNDKLVLVATAISKNSLKSNI